jgi:hypothetical protein
MENEKELRQGRMKTAEIAEWMGISYNTYRKNASARLKILSQYCDFTKYHGGVEITNIIIPCYYGDLDKTRDVENYLECIKSKQDGLSSVKGMVREFLFGSKEEYKDLSFRAIEHRLTRAGEFAFGKNHNYKKPETLNSSGVYGYRSLTWAIKLSD